MVISNVGNGQVLLIAGGGKVYADIAARFVRSEREIKEIANSEYSATIVQNLISSGHYSALEFDYFIFAVSGYSRVTETQLVRKRMASYLIKSGRAELNGKREFSVIYPESIQNFSASIGVGGKLLTVTAKDITSIINQWYDQGLKAGIREEDLRYLKPEGTEFKAIIGMNAHALRDWFKIRCCKNAQYEIRDMANKMLNLCKQASPDLFENAGASCVSLGYCPENKLQNKLCTRRGIPTHQEVLDMISNKTEIRKKSGLKETLKRLIWK